MTSRTENSSRNSLNKKQFLSFVLLGIIISISTILFNSCEKSEEESNTEPTCSITNPSSGTEIEKGETVTISVEAEDEDGNLKEVRFYVDGSGVGSASSFPYSYEWETGSVEEGNHTIKAKAIDEKQASSEDEVQINVIISGGDVNLELVEVSGGTFEMGCTSEQNNCQSNETPVHTVTVDGFKISKYEITNQQYADFMNEIGANSDGSYDGTEYLDMDESDCQVNYTGGEFVPESGKENHPVIEVNWYGAKAFCEYYGGRLPTEAEWEFAARGGNSATTTLYAGSDNIDDVAWYSGNCSSTQEVGTKSPNELGIYDMSGNVWEWCNDWYGSDYYSNSPQDNPQGPSSGSRRVLRGGCWFYGAVLCRVAFRVGNDPVYSDYYYYGFRFSQGQ